MTINSQDEWASAIEDAGHQWVEANDLVKWPHCAVCGIIRRHDDKNNPCKGAAKLSLRNYYTEGSAPLPELGARQILKPKVLCEAPGDRCFGCAHYQGKADRCEHAPTPPLTGETPRTDAIWKAYCQGGDPDAVWKMIRDLEHDLAAANRSLDWCGEQLKACAQYVKEGETVAQAMERNWQDSQNALGLFAKERIRAEKAESALSATQPSPEEIEYLGKFINCAVFSPPPEEVARAHRIYRDLVAARSTSGEREAALGRILLKYIDRLSDPVADDQLHHIVAELEAEVRSTLSATGMPSK